MKIEIGNYAKTEGDRIFKVYGFSYGHDFIPDGWLVDKDGGFTNPKFCTKYNGAISAISHLG